MLLSPPHLRSRHHVKVTHEWQISWKILCPRRQDSGPAVHSYWSCRESLSRGMLQVHGCSLEKLGSTRQPKGVLGEEMGQEEKDFLWTLLEIFTHGDLWHISGGSHNDFIVI